MLGAEEMATDEQLTNELKEYALQHTDKVGITSADSFAQAPRGHKPEEHLPGCKSILVLCMKHLDVFSCSMDKSSQAYSQDLINRALSDACYKISRFIEKKGFLAFPMTESIRMFPFRDECDYQEGRIDLRRAAEFAGIGLIGSIGIVITPEYGPRVQLSAILTDAELVADAPLKKNPCIPGCIRCIDVCPVGAIEIPYVGKAYHPVDQEKCLKYRREHGGASPLGRRNMCSLCRAVCPVGRIR